jgi:L-aminopeptidase/D-esterase-like protein
MENPQIITALLEKRADIRASIAELERQVRKHKADMAQVDATIRLFAPNVTLAKREATRFARSAHSWSAN